MVIRRHTFYVIYVKGFFSFPVCVALNKRFVFFGYRAATGEGNMGYGKWICIPPNTDRDEEDER